MIFIAGNAAAGGWLMGNPPILGAGVFDWFAAGFWFGFLAGLRASRICRKSDLIYP
jgi:hypothetical protein